MNFWPHDAVGWIAIIVPSLGALGWLLNIYVKQPLDRLTAQFEIMKRDTDKELGAITAEQYEEITGEPYVKVQEPA